MLKPFAVFLVAKVGNHYAATTRTDGSIGLPGGKVDKGESNISACIREASEEGWGIVDLHPIPIHQEIRDGQIVQWFSAKTAVALAEYKEKGRITPILATLEEISVVFGNSFLLNIEL